MAIYHLNAKAISRANGRSATAAAAYRAGVKITDSRTGEVHDYRRKRGILHSEIILPGGGSADRSAFWNGLEKHHKRGDAVVAREVEVALPTELDAEQRKALALAFARELSERYGVAVDVALHEPHTITKRDLERNPEQYFEIDPDTGKMHNGNWHAHIMLSACSVAPDGKLGKKVAELDPVHCQRAKIPNTADEFRPIWAERVNAALAAAGCSARVDHRSNEARGIEEAPTKHIGPAAKAAERKIAAMETALAKLKELKAQQEAQTTKPPEALSLLDATTIEVEEIMKTQSNQVLPAPTFLQFLGEKAGAVFRALRGYWQGEKPDPVQGLEITTFDREAGKQKRLEPRQRWLSEADYQAAADQHGRIDLDPELLAQCREIEIELTARFDDTDWADPQARENAALEVLENTLRDRI